MANVFQFFGYEMNPFNHLDVIANANLLSPSDFTTT